MEKKERICKWENVHGSNGVGKQSHLNAKFILILQQELEKALNNLEMGEEVH